ncbi:MAG TPA: CHASE2 domain-containing protein, partial [Thermodesulfobacteriota bacterium]|nr:CHASE2 domain-containing protein [Thermodesulfobacteriota bacterium]
MQAVLLGAATALAGLVASLLPAGAALEESLGLKVLFALRGARPAPAEVLLVGIDKRSAEALGLPRDPARWPRSLHARLTETLARAGARVIAFDLFFEQERGPDDDRRFARAIERAGNVVLARFLTWDTAPLAAPGGPGGHLSVEHLVPPVRLLAEAAAGTAPFPLPKVPVRVNRYWTFKPGAGDAPTLPAVAFQLFALDAYDDLVAHLLRLAPEQARALPRDRRAFVAAGPAEVTVGRIRELFDGAPHLAARLLAQLEAPGAGDDPVRAARLRALVRLYAGPDSPYLDYYGPPGSIRTLPYHEVLALEGEPAGSPRLAPLAGAAVFVGMSEYLRPTQKDGFYTVYSDDEGRDISGVEIAATAFANLLEARPLEPLPPLAHAAVVLAGGAALGVGCRLLPPLWAAAWALAAALAYLAGAQQAFARAGSWWPLVVPLLLQTPLALAAGVAWRYAEVSRERWRIRRLLAYHVPEAVIEELPADFPRGATDGRLAYGVCLATDAERYTGLAESLEPAELAGLMNRYYAALFEPIRRHGGIVSDVVGDAALAIWAGAAPDPTLRARACRAACEVA